MLDPKKLSRKDQELLLEEFRASKARMTPRPWWGRATNKQLSPDNPRHYLPWAHPNTGEVYRCADHNPDCTGPSPDWQTWLLMAGRGYGKTLAGANWVIEMALSEPNIVVAVCSPTFAMVDEVCFDGPTGIIQQALPGEVKFHNKNKTKITMRNGSVIMGFSAENTDSIRGQNLRFAWLDEFSSFSNEEFYTFGLRPALRIKGPNGEFPKMLITTTPKNNRLMLDMMKLVKKHPEHYHLTQATSFENPDATPEIIEEMIQHLTSSGTKQEIYGQLIEMDHALFRLDDFDKYRTNSPSDVPSFRQTVIGVDPATTSNERSDYTGIVAIAEGIDQHSYVLEDCSLKGSPEMVVSAISDAFYRHAADLVVVENNAAGEWFTSMLAQKDAYIPVRSVHAMKGKKVRAGHIAHLNEIGRIHFTDVFRTLEDQLCAMNPDQDRDKMGDDRADAFVWAMAYLAGKPSADWERVYGFGVCKNCGENVHFINDTTCKSCGHPVTADKLQKEGNDKSSIRWRDAYVTKCPRGHKYLSRHRQCPECNMPPEEYIRRAVAHSGTNGSGLGYSGRNWFAGRNF